MNFVQACFEEHICDCIECLENVGFSADEVLKFIPEAALNILDATQNISLYQAITCIQTNNPSSLLISIDADGMSDKLKTESNQVTAGLCAITPVLLGDLLKRSEIFAHLKKGKKLDKTQNLNSSVEKLL